MKACFFNCSHRGDLKDFFKLKDSKHTSKHFHLLMWVLIFSPHVDVWVGVEHDEADVGVGDDGACVALLYSYRPPGITGVRLCSSLDCQGLTDSKGQKALHARHQAIAFFCSFHFHLSIEGGLIFTYLTHCLIRESCGRRPKVWQTSREARLSFSRALRLAWKPQIWKRAKQRRYFGNKALRAGTLLTGVLVYHSKTNCLLFTLKSRKNSFSNDKGWSMGCSRWGS